MKKRLSILLSAVLCVSVIGAWGGDAPKKTLNIAISENIVALDPHAANNLPSYQPRNMCFDPLVETDHQGTFTPSLATEWSYSADGKEITLKLRQGVKFSNGEDFNADDVVCTFDRLKKDKTLAIASIYWSLLDHAEKVDDHTVKIVMKEPYAGVLISLSNTAIIPDKAFAEKGNALFTEQLMYGTGPWVFDQWIDGQYFHVTKNPNYWNKAKFDSYYDDVYVRIVLEASTAIAGHVSGDIQAYIASGGISPDMLTLYKGTEKKVELRNMNTGTIQYLGLQCGPNSPLADLKVRQALAHAIDRQGIVDYVIGGGSVPDSFSVPGTLGFSDKIVHYEFDPAKAKKLLSESSYKGQKLVLISNTGTLKSQETLLTISDNLNEIGFNTSINIVETATMTEMRASGKYDIFLVATMQECGDPMKYITMRVLNDIHKSQYKDEGLFAEIRKSNTELDPVKREALLRDIIVKWSEVLVHFPVVQLASTYAIDYGVQGIELYLDGLYNFKYVTYKR